MYTNKYFNFLKIFKHIKLINFNNWWIIKYFPNKYKTSNNYFTIFLVNKKNAKLCRQIFKLHVENLN